MKKHIQIILITIITLIFISSAIVIAKELQEVEIGAIEESELNLTKGDISYKENWNKEVIGYEKVYYQKQKVMDVCHYDDEPKNTTGEICGKDSYYITSLNESAKGDPIYESKKINSIEYSNKEFLFNNKGCFVCESITVMDTGETYTGKLLNCLKKDYGYSINRGEEFKCKIRTGEIAKIINLENDKIEYLKSNMGDFQWKS